MIVEEQIQIGADGRRTVRHFQLGPEGPTEVYPDLIQLLRFVNSRLRFPGTHQDNCRVAIRSCIQDLISYGQHLLEIKEAGPYRGSWARIRNEIMQSAEVQQLNNRFSTVNFERAWDLIKDAIPQGQYSVFRIVPPVFFVCDFTSRLLDSYSQQVLTFLRLSSRIHPVRWGICSHCEKVYLSGRIARHQFCDTECRDRFYTNQTSRNHYHSRRFFECIGNRDYLRVRRYLESNQFGADTRDEEGTAAAEIAECLGDQRMVELLREYL